MHNILIKNVQDTLNYASQVAKATSILLEANLPFLEDLDGSPMVYMGSNGKALFSVWTKSPVSFDTNVDNLSEYFGYAAPKIMDLTSTKSASFSNDKIEITHYLWK